MIALRLDWNYGTGFGIFPPPPRCLPASFTCGKPTLWDGQDDGDAMVPEVLHEAFLADDRVREEMLDTFFSLDFCFGELGS